MRPSTQVACRTFPCADVEHVCYSVPDVSVKADRVRLVLISECAAADPGDDYYAKGSPLFQQTTVQAFQDAGVTVASVKDLVAMGVYLTTAVKCAKKEYGLASATIAECALLLEQELALFPNVVVYLLMGDTAIKAVNAIARRRGEERVIAAGSTYKIRNQEFFWQGKRVFPSYLQAGPSFFIEKSKRRMIAEDISRAMELLPSSQ